MVLQKTVNVPSSEEWRTLRFLLGFREPEITFVDERRWNFVPKRFIKAENLIAAHNEFLQMALERITFPPEMNFANVPNMVDWIRQQRIEVKTCNPYSDRDHWLYGCYLAAQTRDAFHVKNMGEFNIETEE